MPRATAIALALAMTACLTHGSIYRSPTVHVGVRPAVTNDPGVGVTIQISTYIGQ